MTNICVRCCGGAAKPNKIALTCERCGYFLCAPHAAEHRCTARQTATTGQQAAPRGMTHE